MKHTKAAHRAARPAVLVQQLVGLTLMSILVADPAMAARRGKGLPPGVQLVPVEQSAPQAAAVRPQATKPILRPGRHGSKPRAGAR